MELRALLDSDLTALPRLTQATGFFTDEEVAIVAELAHEARGANPDGYHFVVATEDDLALGFACWGLAGQSDGVYDLYWIVVDPQAQGRGIGRRLIAHAEADAAQRGGRSLVAETEGSATYAPTRAFYLAAGYAELGRIPDFYRVGADKVFYGRTLGTTR